MKNRLISIAIITALAVAGCAESPSETAEDVAEARQDAAADVDAERQLADKDVSKANKQVADARHDYKDATRDANKKLTAAESSAMIVTAKADYDVAMTEAKGRQAVAEERCDALDSVSKKACLSTAEASFAADEAMATASRDKALVAAEHYP